MKKSLVPDAICASDTIKVQSGKKMFMPNLVEGIIEIHYKYVYLFSIKHFITDICDSQDGRK